MSKVTTIIVGAGGFARQHLRAIVNMPRQTAIVGFVEPGEASRAATRAFLEERKVKCPPFYNTIKELVKAQGAAETALICSPHKFHFENARDCLQSGMDVCLEKPMVMNASEARRLIALRDKTARLLVVAFPGSLSPAVRKAKQLLAAGEIGKVTAIAAYAHQNWKNLTTGLWRQVPEISGGGFLFDTGSHMVNTVVDLLGEDVARVTALLDNRGTPVEINSSVSAISKSGVMVSLAGAGDSILCCSQVTVFGEKGVLKTGIWGEFLQVRKLGDADYAPVPYEPSRGAWEQFLKVRQGKIENPCPPEVGLRFARLMDMIRTSAETGQTVKAR
ncbi:MAG: Gfo/Idh/MocA family oxidoreductase [bacterium]|nr:Gfo/Idh/MocA family oxidoreductase [bacterium]